MSQTISEDELLALTSSLFSELAKVFLGRVSYSVLCEQMCHALVEEGMQHVSKRRQGKLVLSHIALITGVKISLIKAYRDSPLQLSCQGITAEAKLLRRWSTHAAYQNEQGTGPRPLVMYGPGASFQSLVTFCAGRGVTAQTVMEKLLEKGNIRVFDENWLELIDPHWPVMSQAEFERLQTMYNNIVQS